MKKAGAVGIICLFALSSMASDLVGSFKEAVAKAEAQEEAPATRDYFASTLLPYYAQKYGPVLQACFKSLTGPGNTPFSFVAAIGPDGRVMRLYTDHQTSVFRCMRKTLEADKFPGPPESPYYMHIEMQFADDARPGASANSAPPLIVQPDKYSYTFGVPKGWEYSFEQAHQRGAALAFFPSGGSFNGSSSVIYVNEIDDGCSSCKNVLPARIASTIHDAKDESPQVRVETGVPVTTIDGGKALIRLLKGSRDPRDSKPRQDNEALAFIAHDETIILVVLTARDAKTWDQDYDAFQQVVAGHKFFNCASPDLKVPCGR